MSYTQQNDIFHNPPLCNNGHGLGAEDRRHQTSSLALCPLHVINNQFTIKRLKEAIEDIMVQKSDSEDIISEVNHVVDIWLDYVSQEVQLESDGNGKKRLEEVEDFVMAVTLCIINIVFFDLINSNDFVSEHIEQQRKCQEIVKTISRLYKNKSHSTNYKLELSTICSKTLSTLSTTHICCETFRKLIKDLTSKVSRISDIALITTDVKQYESKLLLDSDARDKQLLQQDKLFHMLATIHVAIDSRKQELHEAECQHQQMTFKSSTATIGTSPVSSGTHMPQTTYVEKSQISDATQTDDMTITTMQELLKNQLVDNYTQTDDSLSTEDDNSETEQLETYSDHELQQHEQVIEELVANNIPESHITATDDSDDDTNTLYSNKGMKRGGSIRMSYRGENRQKAFKQDGTTTVRSMNAMAQEILDDLSDKKQMQHKTTFTIMTSLSLTIQKLEKILETMEYGKYIPSDQLKIELEKKILGQESENLKKASNSSAAMIHKFHKYLQKDVMDKLQSCERIVSSIIRGAQSTVHNHEEIQRLSHQISSIIRQINAKLEAKYKYYEQNKRTIDSEIRLKEQKMLKRYHYNSKPK